MRVAIVGAGLAGLAAAVDLVDAGHQVDLYEARPFMGGK
ncbi:MAG: FAD-dependent oxidoreductase, partial [Cyanobium sp.]